METKIGYIFFPDEENDTISARLSIKKLDILLELPINYDGIQKLDIVLGVFNSCGKVTLLDCTYAGFETGAGANILTFKVTYLFKGAHINSINKLLFSQAAINFPSLHKWLNIHIVKFFEDTLNIKYPKPINTATLEYYKLSFNFKCRQSFAEREIHFKESTCLIIEAIREELSLWDFIDIINKFKKFILFIINLSPKIEDITFYNKEFLLMNTNQQIPIDFITCWNEKAQNNFFNGFSLSYKEIENCLSSIIKNWHENSDLNVIIDLVLTKTDNPDLSKESYFLNCCFAIETFHRRFKKKNVFTKPEFKKLKKEILSSINKDGEIYKFIEKKLAYANEPTFKDRLDDLVEDFKQLLSDQEDVENYIKTIVDTRNSLVHQSSKKKIFKGLELLYASKYVESVVKINIFRVLGVPEEVIQKSIINAKGELSEMYRFNKRLQLSLPNTAYKK